MDVFALTFSSGNRKDDFTYKIGNQELSPIIDTCELCFGSVCLKVLPDLPLYIATACSKETKHVCTLLADNNNTIIYILFIQG